MVSPKATVDITFLSTPSARWATHHVRGAVLALEISIHALREEGDSFRLVMMTVPLVFLSTPSARRATGVSHVRGADQINFYPRPPRGGRRNRQRSAGDLRAISIHALREEGDG